MGRDGLRLAPSNFDADFLTSLQLEDGGQSSAEHSSEAHLSRRVSIGTVDTLSQNSRRSL